MSLQVEKMEKNMAKLTIEVAAEDLEKAMQNAYQKAKGRISIPGFRKGKAPRKMIEQMYGKANLRSFPSRQSTLHRLSLEKHSSSQQKLLLNRKLH